MAASTHVILLHFLPPATSTLFNMNISPTNSREDSEEVRLLSFDGSDLRAVSQLIILDEFMRRIEEERKSATRILPCEYFHMMGGVGASGIIVILLTVLRMGIEETIEEFIKIWNQVFADVTLDQRARSAKLEVVVNHLLSRRGVGESQRMDNGTQGDNSCKAFVCAIPESNLGICEKFRTYKSKETSLDPTIVEATRATCAVPALFLPVSIQSVGCQVSYISGAYNFNNPAAETIKEACQYFGRDRRVACMLSLGCGQRAITRLSQANEKKVLNLVNDFACDCERVDRDLGWRVGDSNVYYRLSVNQILDSSGTDAINSIGDITSCTKGFLDHHETASKMNKCVQVSESIGGVTLRDISGVSEPRSTSVHGLPSLSKFFVERPALMTTMAQRLFQLGPSTQRRMVLSGLGGIGKTQITIRFLLRYLARFRHILFIDGSSEQSIESGLVAKVKSLGVTYSRDSASDALEVLANPDYEITRDWAIIYDNVDNPNINVGRYFPSCAFGTIIVTTRNPNVGIMLAPKAHLKLDVMSGEEASEVLLRSAIDASCEPTDVEKEEVHKIAKELGYLPVALVQAGYFIRIHDCLVEFRERLRKRRPDILGRPAEYQLDPHDGLYGVLDLTWPHLTHGAQKFMSILGFVNYTGFPVTLLYRAAARGFLFEPFELADRPPSFQDTIRVLYTAFWPQEEWDKQDVDDLVAELEKYSLVTRMITFKVTTLRLHPLVHSWTRDRLSKEEKATYRAAAVRLLVCGTGRDDEDIYEFLVPHLGELSNWLGELHLNDRAGLATVISHRGRLREAIEIWDDIKKALDSSQGIWKHPVGNATYELRCSEVALQLACLRWRPGDSCTSLVLDDEVIKVRKRILGCEHPKTLEAVVQQARAMRYTSPKDAERLLRDVLNAWERQPGDSDNREAVLRTKEALARCCDKIESISLYKEILQVRVKLNGPAHHATLKAMENLANNPSSSASATDIWISIVTARTNSRGREHPDTLDAMENLARSYTFQLLYAKSMEQWEEVIHFRKGVQGVAHCATISAMNELALVLGRIGHRRKLTPLLEEIVQATKEVHGASHTNTLKAMRYLANVYKRGQQQVTRDAHDHSSSWETFDAMTGLAKVYEKNLKYTEAEVQWKEIVQVMADVHGPSYEYTLEAMRDLARLYQRIKWYKEAEVQWKQIVQMTKEAHGAGHMITLQAMRALADMYARAKQYTEADAEWKEILQVMKDAYGPSHKDTLKAARDLAQFYERNQQYTEAEVQWKQIVQVTKEAHGASHTDTLKAMRELAGMYASAGQYTEEEAERKEILQLTRAAHGHSSSETLKAMRDLVNFYTKAEAQWEQILQVMKDVHGASHTDTLEATTELADMYASAKQYTKAEAKWKEILQVMKDAHGPSHKDTLKAARDLAQFYERNQQYTEAEVQWKEIVQVMEDVHGASHEDTLEAMRDLAWLYQRIQWYKEAEVQWKQFVQATKEAHGASHTDTLKAMTELADMYASAKQYTEEEAERKEILQVTRAAHGHSSSETLKAIRDLAKFYERNQQYTKAEAQWKQILQVMKDVHGASHKNTLKAMRGLAWLYQGRQWYTEAEVQWKKIVQVMKEAHGTSHTGTLKAMRGLADMYESAEQYTKAEAEWKEVLQVIRETHSPSHSDMLEAMRGLANTYGQAGMYTKAEVQWKEIVQLTKEQEDTDNLLGDMLSLAETFKKTEQYKEAEMLWSELVRLAMKTIGRICSSFRLFENMKRLVELCKTLETYEDAEAVLGRAIKELRHSDDFRKLWMEELLREVRFAQKWQSPKELQGSSRWGELPADN